MPLCFVSIGSNIDRENNVRAALAALHEHFGPLLLSAVRETAAVGFTGAPFLNLVAAFFTEQPPPQVAAILTDIENRHGRERGRERFGPRTLDIDLLMYGDRRDAHLKIPRPEIAEHAFVLEPLAEIAPRLRHPAFERPFAELWKDLQRRGN